MSSPNGQRGNGFAQQHRVEVRVIARPRIDDPMIGLCAALLAALLSVP
jgi:hypothetical protein